MYCLVKKKKKEMKRVLTNILLISVAHAELYTVIHTPAEIVFCYDCEMMKSSFRNMISQF